MAVALTPGVGRMTALAGLPERAPVAARPLAAAPLAGDEYRPTVAMKLANARRTVTMAVTELFGGHTIDEPKSLHKPWQRALHRLLPGGLVTAAFSKFQPDPAGAAIPAGPLDRAVDPRAVMPLVHFEAGETAFPTDPGFDGNGDVNDNLLTYRRGKTDGNQEPTFYVSGATVGDYTVLRYDVYYVDNRYMNFHPHDWEGFSVYLKPDASGALKPAYLMTSWHYDQILTPWSDLVLDASGKPTVLVDRGGHGSRPLKRHTAVPAGRTLHPQGYWLDSAGRAPQPVHLRGSDQGLLGIEPVRPLPGGQDPRQVPYPSGDWILGFIRVGNTVDDGPMARPSWKKPLHPIAYGMRGTVWLGAAKRAA